MNVKYKYSTRKINKVILYFALLMLLGCNGRKDVLKIGNNEYKLIFVDDFNGTALDTNKWVYRTDSKHWSTQLTKNVDVNNGYLFLNLKKEKSLDKDYTGAGIISVDTYRYGFYEARLKIPDGQGWHTSFWLMKNDGFGTKAINAEIEIDILENDSKHPNFYSIAFHKWLGGHVSVFGKKIVTPNMSNEFVTVACEYTPKYIIYYMNGEKVRYLDISDFKQGDVNIWLTSIASWLGGTDSVNELKLPGKAIFDYVKYYKLVKN